MCLIKDEKQEGLLKRLKNIEDKTDKQLNENKDSKLALNLLLVQSNKNYHKKQKICWKS